MTGKSNRSAMAANDLATELPKLPSELVESIRLITAYLIGQEGVSGIWLFGSLAKGSQPDWRSDIDVAVRGLAASNLGGVWSELDARIPQSLDLVRWEDASDLLKREIVHWGGIIICRLIWERPLRCARWCCMTSRR